MVVVIVMHGLGERALLPDAVNGLLLPKMGTLLRVYPDTPCCTRVPGGEAGLPKGCRMLARLQAESTRHARREGG